MIKHFQIHNQPNSDTFRILIVYAIGGFKWEQKDYGTIGEAARDVMWYQRPIYNCTGRKKANKRNLITEQLATSGELG